MLKKGQIKKIFLIIFVFFYSLLYLFRPVYAVLKLPKGKESLMSENDIVFYNPDGKKQENCLSSDRNCQLSDGSDVSVVGDSFLNNDFFKKNLKDTFKKFDDSDANFDVPAGRSFDDLINDLKTKTYKKNLIFNYGLETQTSTLTENQINQILLAIGSDKTILFVNNYDKNGTFDTSNKKIEELAKDNQNLKNIDFASKISSDQSLVSADGRSLTENGAKDLVGIISSILNSGCSGSFTKYNFTDGQIRGITAMAEQENGSSPPVSIVTEASQMANLFESDLMKKYNQNAQKEQGFIDMLTKSGWYHSVTVARYSENANVDNTVFEAVKMALNSGRRTLPTKVAEHDSINDIASVTNDGTPVDKRNKSNYIPKKSIIKNTLGSTYTFYRWADPNVADNKKGDPFGYIGDSVGDLENEANEFLGNKGTSVNVSSSSNNSNSSNGSNSSNNSNNSNSSSNNSSNNSSTTNPSSNSTADNNTIRPSSNGTSNNPSASISSTGPSTDPDVVVTADFKNYAGDEILSQAERDTISKYKHIYEEAAKTQGFPWQILATLHYREYSLKVSNPSNLQGIYQLYSYTQGGKNSNAFSPAGPVSEEEFLRQSKIAAEIVKQKEPELTERPDAKVVKLFFFKYNGTAKAYINQALDMGFTKEQADIGEGSPYVMSRADAKRDSTKGGMSWTMYTGDHSKTSGHNETNFGAYVVYLALGGLTDGSGTCSTSYGAGNDKIAQTALELAWITYDTDSATQAYFASPMRSSARKNGKPVYKEALKKVKNVDDESDCGRFVSTVLRYSEVDPNYPPVSVRWSLLPYMQKHPELYEEIKNTGDTSILKPGDILAVAGDKVGHIKIIANINGKIHEVQASWHNHAPETDEKVNITDKRGPNGMYQIFRKK